MIDSIKTRKKLIEVALPLEAINEASAREKSIRHGHPSTLHLWWARRPLAAARAVIFSQMVDDPSEYVDELLADSETRTTAVEELAKRRALWDDLKANHDAASNGDAAAPGPGPEPTLDDCAADIERERIFLIVRELVQWENTTSEAVLQQARDEIWRSWRRTCADNANHPQANELFNAQKLPGFHDPFAGGGSLPLEAQRLGLEAYASDLNPVAVLINKAMVEIPPKFAGQSPVNPESRAEKRLVPPEWRGAQGLAEDVRYYGRWMRAEAEKRIGYLYPKVEVTTEMAVGRPDLKPLVGREVTVMAWLWARTVKSPNPAFAQVDVPLASSFMLSTKPGKEAYVDTVIEDQAYRFTVGVGKPRNVAQAGNGTKSAGSHSSFLCLMSGTPMPFDYLRNEARAGRMGVRLMAVVAEGERGRVFLPPTEAIEAVAMQAEASWKPDVEICHWPGRTNVVEYGMAHFGELFTARQLVMLTTLCDLVEEGRERIENDALAAGMVEGENLVAGGIGATAYSDAVAVYLAFLVSQVANHSSSVCGWNSANTQMRSVFARQAIPMVWDFAESNPFCNSSGSFNNLHERLVKGFAALGEGGFGCAMQADANSQAISTDKLVSTDPPYYDNIEYADLSDFFYVWLRRSLRPIFPDLFATLAVPKAEELVANPYRRGSREKAEAFFLGGMTQAMRRLAQQAHPAFPIALYYAFKQSESDSAEGAARTGWETFLNAVFRAGLATTGTWPIRTEKQGRVIGNDSNALASSIVLVCRPRATDAPEITRGEFAVALSRELPKALAHLQRGNIAPVDLAQAAVGPGMAVYTRYGGVLNANGSPLSVGRALALINETLDSALSEQEGDFDAESRWALEWFEQSGFSEGQFGVAQVLARAKNTSIDGMADGGILISGGGKVRLLKPDELPRDWDPDKDRRLTTWGALHHLLQALDVGGERAAAKLVARLGTKAENARELCYRLYVVADRKKRTAEAQAYNAMVLSWPEISRLARETATAPAAQAAMFAEPGA